jgi:hypothetical protein
MPKHKNWFWLTALAAAWCFDFLFWKKPFGLSFFIWTALLLGIGYLLAWWEGKRPKSVSIAVTLLILAFSFVPVWRSEPFVLAVSVMLALGGMLLLTATFLNGNWPFYRLWDYISELAQTIWGGLSGAILMGTRGKTPPPVEQPVKKSFFRKTLPVLRGVLLALPVVAILAVLLSSADPVFGDWLKHILNLEKLPEYLFRLGYILLIGSFLVGIYLHAILPKKESFRPGSQKSIVTPFFGWTEAGIILGAVDVLFLAFVFIQIRYLFGGTVNINETGYTFAEYARRGFGELVAVAVLSLLLYLGLNTITKRERRASQIGFTVFSVLLMANVLVILASSLQRLLLYENAYGFSQLRTHTHVFIFWLAGLILATIILEILRRRERFALALLVTVLGFGITLAVMNVDAFIVDRNVSRAISGEQLDIQYLNTLSADAVPEMFEKFNDATLPVGVKDSLGSALACWNATMEDPGARPWQGFNFSKFNAYKLLKQNAPSLSKYQAVKTDQEGWVIKLNGKDIPCSQAYFMD